MTQQHSESVFFFWCLILMYRGKQLFSPLKLQYTLTFSQLEWLRGCNGHVIITIIKRSSGISSSGMCSTTRSRRVKKNLNQDSTDGCAAAEKTPFGSKAVLHCSWHLLILCGSASTFQQCCFGRVTGRSLFISACQSQPKTSPHHSLLDSSQTIKICLPIKPLTLLVFHLQTHPNTLSYSSLHMPLFPESAIKWKGWLPLLMLHAAGGTHKPHPKHSQETHKDPTRQDNLAHTAIN